ncbi:gliding motility-associated C-terminal domain-containing protein [Candidatus Amoebophilus asiaticus]|nr:gliding motility-associated C-terminal domain-containing protein [Candidatus Amoebophilus asiaticus]
MVNKESFIINWIPKHSIHHSGKIGFLILLMFFFKVSNSQKQANFWYFGEYAGIEFTGGSPVPVIGGQTNTLEGTATISDTSGNHLFYTDGVSVWNANHTTMPNGTGLAGGNSSSQSALIVPMPKSDSIYYIFTLPPVVGSAGFRYSTVDITLNGGLGDVVAKNISVLYPATEKSTAIKHGNKNDFWIVIHAWNSDNFHAYLLTDTGLSSTPVISSTGIIHTGDVLNTVGSMIFSPNGYKIALAMRDTGIVEVFDFDILTGLVSNPVTIQNLSDAYGIAFSQDNSKLYVTNLATDLFQFDLDAGSQAAVVASQTLVGSSSSGALGQLQIGLDSRIYVSRHDTSYMGIINYPDSVGVACNYVDVGLYLNGPLSQKGIPNFVQSYFKKVTSFSNNVVCQGDTTEFFGSPSWMADTWTWYFGDSSSGSADTSYLQNPGHVFTAADTFYTTLIISKNTILDTVVRTVIVKPIPSLNVGVDTLICTGETISLGQGISADSYLWSTGETTQTIQVVSQDTYWLTISNNNCSNTDSVFVEYYQKPSENLGNDTALCIGQSIVLDAGNPGAIYLWSTGETSQSIQVDTAGNYWVEIIDSICNTSDSVAITFSAVPTVNLGNDTSFCDGNSVILDAGNAGASFLWSTGNTTQTIQVASNGNYWVRVDDGLCVTLDTLNVSILLTPNINLGNDTNLCANQTALLDAGNPAANYYWSTGDTIQIIQIDTTGYFWVEVTYGTCVDNDSISITFYPSPVVSLGNDTTICEGNSITLDAGNTGASYIWSTGYTTQSIQITDAGSYWVEAKIGNCSHEDTIIISLYPLPVINLGNDTGYCSDQVIILDAGNPGASYLWSTGHTTQSITLVDTGMYWVEVAGNNCTFSDTVTINIMDAPARELNDYYHICKGDFVMLDAGNPGAFYSWSTGDTTKTIVADKGGIYNVVISNTYCSIDDSTSVIMQRVDLGKDTSLCEEFKDIMKLDPGSWVTYYWNNGYNGRWLTINKEGTYIVTVSYNTGCTMSDTIFVDNKCPEAPFVPNTFTPNNDGLNDVFKVIGIKHDDFEMRIYNKWRHLIFYSKDIKEGWDGTYNGLTVPQGIYFWVIYYKQIDSPELDYLNYYSGYIYVLRTHLDLY